MLLPDGLVTTSATIANEVGLQPSRQSMFAGWLREPIGDQYQGATHPVIMRIFSRNRWGTVSRPIEQTTQPQFLSQRVDDQRGSPGAGVQNLDIPLQAQLTRQLAFRFLAFPLKQSLELRQDRLQRVSASKVRDDLLTALALLADRRHHAYVFTHGAAGT